MKMRKLIKDINGAVTVFITLLLIPAVLISGTTVDLARIHTAYSTIENANHLAANTMLTQYNALLYDIYGIMGIAQDDPILERLLDEYITVTVFGEELQDRTIGTLQLFYGANIHMTEPYFPEGKNLRDEQVLRRQIEEYMKFRGPILLVSELLDKLSENRIQNDAQLINDKMEIDTAIADIFEKYRQLYNAIVAADRCTQAIGGIAGGSFGYTSSVLTYIYDEFVELGRLQQMYLIAEEPAHRAYIQMMYNARFQNIRSLTIGGPRIGFFQDGSWGRRTNINVGLTQAIENAIIQAENFKPNFDRVLTIAREIDAMKAELKQKIDDFERRIQSGEISQELVEAFTQPYDNPEQSILGRYRALIRWEITPMAEVYRNGGYSYIDDIHKPMLEAVRYRNRYSPGWGGLSIGELTNIPFDGRFDILTANLQSYTSFPRDNITYKMLPGFLRFAEHPGENEAFFEELHTMMNGPALPPVRLFDGQENATGGDIEEQQRSMIDELLNIVHTAYNGLTNEPLGAMYINEARAPDAEAVNVFEILELIPEAASAPSLSIIQDPLGSLARASDYVLLLTYSTSMFSNYSTAKPQSIGHSGETPNPAHLDNTISGVPMSPEVNYFYQSELEYLYHGSESAAANLSSVTRLLLLVRLICNYIKVFSVSEVTTIVTSIKAAFSWAPPLALILGELARAAFVAAESVIDVAALRTGHRVPLFKNVAAGEWIATPSGVLRAATNVITGESVDGDRFNNSRGLSYMNYMLFFFLTKAVFDGNATTELTNRTANLIEWNIINYDGNINADEAQMAQALAQSNSFRLENMKTDFSFTTTVDLRMLFLSMIFAQNFSQSRGIGVPSAMPISVTTRRGY